MSDISNPIKDVTAVLPVEKRNAHAEEERARLAYFTANSAAILAEIQDAHEEEQRK